jgi:hypothetical protein
VVLLGQVTPPPGVGDETPVARSLAPNPTPPTPPMEGYAAHTDQNTDPRVLEVACSELRRELEAARTELKVRRVSTPKSSLGDAKSSLGDAKSSLGDAESSLGDVKSSLGDATSSLGDAKSSLGDAKSSLGDASIIGRWQQQTLERWRGGRLGERTAPRWRWGGVCVRWLMVYRGESRRR